MIDLDSTKQRVIVTNKGTTLRVITWLLLAAMCLAISFRLLTRLFLKEVRRVRTDEVFLLFAFVCMP